MRGFFELIGVCVALYAGYAAVTGSVFVRHRAWGRTVVRGDEPIYFWSVIVIYGLLAVALIFYF